MSRQGYTRPQAAELLRRLGERRRFMQVVTGARQVGKTTLVTQVVEKARLPYVFASADEPTLRGSDWIDEQYLFYGGYPGAAPLIGEPDRWARYIRDSLIETTIARDVLLLSRVDKPAVLRRLFELGCAYSGQILSYTKMLGQLQDAGNTTTLAHYLELLAGAGMLVGLQKYAAAAVRQRGSSPKLQVLNTALMTAPSSMAFSEARRDREFWGRLVESAVGAHLANAAAASECEVLYWRGRDVEGDLRVREGESVTVVRGQNGWWGAGCTRP